MPFWGPQARSAGSAGLHHLPQGSPASSSCDLCGKDKGRTVLQSVCPSRPVRPWVVSWWRGRWAGTQGMTGRATGLGVFQSSVTPSSRGRRLTQCPPYPLSASGIPWAPHPLGPLLPHAPAPELRWGGYAPEWKGCGKGWGLSATPSLGVTAHLWGWREGGGSCPWGDATDGQLGHQELILRWFWRMEVQDQCADRFVPSEASPCRWMVVIPSSHEDPLRVGLQLHPSDLILPKLPL